MKVVSIFILFIFGFTLNAQNDSTRLVEYNASYKFKDGIFLDFSQVKSNSPIPKSRILTSYDYSRNDFYDKILLDKRVYFYDDYGMRREVSPLKIWGYSRNGILYINFQKSFQRISLIGSICHFVASINVSNPQYVDPFYYNSYNRYNSYGINSPSYSTTELRQYLLEFESGQIFEYGVSSVEVLLMNDIELHDEFMKLRRKKKKQMKFYYIRQFNKRNKLFLPKVN